MFLENENENWKLVLVKAFEFLLPFPITSECRVITQDVINVIMNNEKSKNKSTITLKTQQISEENYIFDCNSIFLCF